MTPHKGEMAEVVLQPVGIMGDTLCSQCGTRFEVDQYCANGHMKPTPKPAIGEQLDMVDAVAKYGIRKLNPASGEWTAEKVDHIIQDAFGNPAAAVAAAHNAAVKEAYQKGYEDGNNTRSSG